MAEETVVEFIEKLQQAPPLDAARLIEDNLGEGTSGDVDDGAIRFLNGRRSGDSVLDHLPLSVIEGFAERCLVRLARAEADLHNRWCRQAWGILDIVRRSHLARRIVESGATDEWSERILRLIEASQFTFGRLFDQRAATYGSRSLFKVPRPSGYRSITWQQVKARVEVIARALLAVTAESGERPLAILSKNRLEVALIDLACLNSRFEFYLG